MGVLNEKRCNRKERYKITKIVCTTFLKSRIGGKGKTKKGCDVWLHLSQRWIRWIRWN